MEVGISNISPPVPVAAAIVHPEIARAGAGAGTARRGSAHLYPQFFKYLELPVISCSISVPETGPHIFRAAG